MCVQIHIELLNIKSTMENYRSNEKAFTTLDDRMIANRELLKIDFRRMILE